MGENEAILCSWQSHASKKVLNDQGITILWIEDETDLSSTSATSTSILNELRFHNSLGLMKTIVVLLRKVVIGRKLCCYEQLIE